jgi:glycosyltransferase involved in cell wall biosynthesis
MAQDVSGKHIVHITESLAGGVLRAIDTWTRVQVADNFRITVYYLEREDTPSSKALRGAFHERVELHSLGKSGFRGFLNMLVKIFALSKQDRPIIHLHSSWAGLIGRLTFASKHKMTLVYSPHCFAFARRDVTSVVTFVFKKAEQIMSRSNVRILALTSTEKKLAEELGNKNVIQVPNFIDLPTLPERKVSSGKILVLSVGRLAEQKRPDRVVEVYDYLKHEARLDFLWVGDGDKFYKEELERRIKVTGWLREDKVRRIFSQADIFLLLSDWEGLPFTALDAYAYGVPIISWDFDGCTDFIVDRHTGYIVQSVPEVVSRIQGLLENEVERKSMGQNARHFVEKNYDLEILKKDWRHFYGV